MSVFKKGKHKVERYNTQGKIFPVVTTDYKEFWRLSVKKGNYTSNEHSPSITGLYFESIIWVKNLHSPLVLGHEFTHHILRSIGNHDGGTCLFFNFLNTVYEEVYGFVRHKNWRIKGCITLQLESIRDAWNDWLDWQLCRN